jgi:hypothetical protein
MKDKNYKRYVVYALRYTDTGIPFYYGKGLPNRPKRHYTPSSRKKNHPKNDIINNFDTYYTIEREGLTNGEANAYEKELIALWGFENLTNKTRGGSGSDGFKHSAESLAKMSGENNPMFGMTGNKNPMYAKNHTPEAKAKQSEARVGKYSGLNNSNFDDSVYKFQHKDGRIESCTQSELRTKYGLNPGHLSSVVNGKRKSTGSWRLVT